MATAEERINGQATQDLIDIGVNPGIARRIVALKGDPSDSKLFAGVAADIRGRSKTRARALWQRRNDLAAAEARFVGLQADLEAKQLASIPAWERRLAKNGVALPSSQAPTQPLEQPVKAFIDATHPEYVVSELPPKSSSSD